MRSLLKRLGLYALPVALVFAAMVSSPAGAAQFCANYINKPCWSEGQQFLCTYFGCPSWIILDGYCVCENGRWNCPDDIECGGSAAVSPSPQAIE